MATAIDNLRVVLNLIAKFSQVYRELKAERDDLVEKYNTCEAAGIAQSQEILGLKGERDSLQAERDTLKENLDKLNGEMKQIEELALAIRKALEAIPVPPDTGG